MRNSQGQASLVMIFLFAIALIFFAISLNWGKIAQTKSQTLIGANAAVMATGSVIASDAQSKWMQNLGGSFDGGRPQKCANTNFWVAIVGVVLAAIGLALSLVTAGGSLFLMYLAIAALVMSVANVALQVAVIQPGLTNMWNKLQKKLKPEAYFLEQGITAGAQTIINDNARVPDIFDMDMDARFLGGPTGNDETNRFGFFYTERLKMLQPRTVDGVSEFVAAIYGLTLGDPSGDLDCSLPQNLKASCCSLDPKIKPEYGCGWKITDAPCQDTKDARCNSCCLPKYMVVPNPFQGDKAMCAKNGLTEAECDLEKLYQILRPDVCQTTESALANNFSPKYSASKPIGADEPVAMCMAEANPFGRDYPDVYDPMYQNYLNTNVFSFLKFIGEDAVAGTNAAGVPRSFGEPTLEDPQYPGLYSFSLPGNSPPIIRGTIFPLLWNMKDKLGQASDHKLVDATGASTGRNIDGVSAMTNFVAAQAQCPATDFSAAEVPQGWWKPKRDGMCNVTGKLPAPWPYDESCDDLRGTKDADGNFVSQKCDRWHDDALDLIAKQAPRVVDFVSQLSKFKASELEQSLEQWYPMAAQLIAPQCKAGCAATNMEIACNPDLCSEDKEGILRQWRQVLGGSDGRHGLIKVMDDWLTNAVSQQGQPFCVPDGITADMSALEQSLYADMNGVSQTRLEKTGKCLSFYQHADAAFKGCLDTCSSENCTNLPRSMVPGFNPNAPNPALPRPDKNARIREIHEKLNSLPANDSTVPDLQKELASLYNGTACQAGSAFLKNIAQSYDVALKNKDAIRRRANVVNFLTMAAINARYEFTNAYLVLDSFLGPQGRCDTLAGACDAPAYKLIKARRDYTQEEKNVNNFFIYGWKGPKSVEVQGAPEGKNQRQYWHLARVEVKMPQLCPGNVCRSPRIPWIKSRTPNVMKRCYVLENTTGLVLTRVTRWDEDHDAGNGVRFMNNVPLWKFTTSDPTKKAPEGKEQEATIANMEQACASVNAFDQSPLGMTKESWDVIHSLTSLSLEDKKKFGSAFMVSLLPGKDYTEAKIKTNGALQGAASNAAQNTGTNLNANSLEREKQCLKILDQFLQRGISSTACSNYYFRNDRTMRHMAVKFTTCPNNAFKENETDHL